jgi:hypothetical protein
MGIPGFTVSSFCDCTLHTLDMGVSARFCGTAMMLAIKSNIYGINGIGRAQRGVLKMRADIHDYYRREHKANPAKKLSRMKSKFTLKLLVSKKTKHRPCLKAKGGETRCLVKFATELMERDKCGDKGRVLAEAGRQLLTYYKVMDENPRKMTVRARQQLLESAINHVTLYKSVGGHLVHKHHSWIHMTLDAIRTGNPKLVSTYEDESENGIIARIGVAVHPSTFSRSSFERLFLQDRSLDVRKAKL